MLNTVRVPSPTYTIPSPIATSPRLYSTLPFHAAGMFALPASLLQCLGLERHNTHISLQVGSPRHTKVPIPPKSHLVNHECYRGCFRVQKLLKSPTPAWVTARKGWEAGAHHSPQAAQHIGPSRCLGSSRPLSGNSAGFCLFRAAGLVSNHLCSLACLRIFFSTLLV